MKMIEVFGLYKKIGVKNILKDINFFANKGDIVAITGESGQGKSTFLRCLIGLEQIDSGSIKIEKEFLVENGKYSKNQFKLLKKLGLIFQNFNLFSNLTVKQNIELPSKNAKIWNDKKIFEKSENLMKKFRIEDVKKSYPENLSGGQKQRVAIARALIMEPKIILFDEPTSALDPKLVEELTRIIKELSNSDYTIIVVTHDITFAEKTSNIILKLRNGNFEY